MDYRDRFSFVLTFALEIILLIYMTSLYKNAPKYVKNPDLNDKANAIRGLWHYASFIFKNAINGDILSIFSILLMAIIPVAVPFFLRRRDV